MTCDHNQCQSKDSCTHQQAACEKLYAERNERHKSEVAAIGHNVDSTLLSIKNLVLDSRNDMLSRGDVEKIVNENIIIFMASSGAKDLAKGTVALPAVVSLLVSVVILLSSWFAIRSAVENDIHSLRNSIEIHSRDIQHIEKTIGDRINDTKTQ